MDGCNFTYMPGSAFPKPWCFISARVLCPTKCLVFQQPHHCCASCSQSQSTHEPIKSLYLHLPPVPIYRRCFITVNAQFQLGLAAISEVPQSIVLHKAEEIWIVVPILDCCVQILSDSAENKEGKKKSTYQDQLLPQLLG